MPYKDPEDKREWELNHRPERLERRRELRRIKAAQIPQGNTKNGGASVTGIPILAGAALASYDPKLALGAGALALAAAAYYRKGWQWWLVGALTVFFALLILNWGKSHGTEEKK